MRSWRKFKDENSRGAAALEVSLALPVLLLALFGTVEFGRAFWIREALASAAAEAARVGSQSSCPRATQAQVIAAANSSLLSSGLMPSLASFTLDNAGGEAGTELVVDATYSAEFPVLSRLLSLTAITQGAMQLSAHIEVENE